MDQTHGRLQESLNHLWPFRSTAGLREHVVSVGEVEELSSEQTQELLLVLAPAFTSTRRFSLPPNITKIYFLILTMVKWLYTI